METHGWAGKLALPSAVVKEMAERQGVDRAWIKGGKVLVDPVALEPANKIRSAARSA